MFKIKKNEVFLFGTSFFVLKIHVLAFLYYANLESEDISGNIRGDRCSSNFAIDMYISKQTK